MTSLEKIQSEHLNRRACVYLRQSTMAQLVEHTESTARQYALQSRATELGWPVEQVQVIDEDLGQSGQTADGRSGFQRLAEDVAHGRVGAIFAVEVRENLSNRRWPDQRGAARDGMGLLQGLVLCGRCSRRMRMRYMGRENLSYYVCDKGKWEDMACAVCWSVATPPIDEAVEKLFLETMQPPELDLSLVVAREVEKQTAEVDKQWQLRLERARYEARQAERRYRTVDAENRLVARTLERDWEDKLREVTELEREHEEVRRREHLELTDRDRKAILALAKDLPRVWRAPSTTGADRKNLLRMVIREVVLLPIDVPRRATSMQILWQTGHSTTLEVLRRGRGQHIATSPDAVAVIRELTTVGKTDEEIAEELNHRELRTGTGKSWTAGCVLKVRVKRKLFKPKEHRYRSQPMPDRRADGAYSVRGAAKALDVTPSVIYYWNKTGRLRGLRDGEHGAWWFDLDDDAVQCLRREAAE